MSCQLVQGWLARGQHGSPSDVGEGQVALGGLIGLHGDGRADSDDFVGGVHHAHKVAADVAEVGKEHRVPLVQHLEPARTRPLVTNISSKLAEGM